MRLRQDCACANLVAAAAAIDSEMMLGERAERVRARLVKNWKHFLKFLYNKDNGEILGRTWLSWIKILFFYMVFYLFFTGILALHLSAFLAITPHPGKDTTPWNFGKYAYPNYPNSKIALVPVPKVITYRHGHLVFDDATYKGINALLPSAYASGVSSACLNESTTYGYATKQPCIFLHVARVFHWTPDLINASLSGEVSLPITCSFESSQGNLVINVTSNQIGIPLNLNNSDVDDGQSFPYSGQTDYDTPLMAVRLDLKSLPTGLPESFSASITCGVDFNGLGMVQPSERKLKRLYEVPDTATIRVNFRL